MTAALRRPLMIAAILAVALVTAWAAAAVWFDGPRSQLAAALLAFGLVAAVAALALLVRPPARGLALALLPLAVVVVWWLRIPASNDREWQRDVARTPTAVSDGSRVTVHDVRNFDYRSEKDYTERWETREIDLDRLSGLDLFVSFWGPTLYAHTILSFQFEGAPPLAVSIETRKQVGEEYSAVRGFFRQFELVYVVADERDVVRLRTSFRGETVHLYRLTTPPARARALLGQFLSQANALASQPAWYNALTLNCTTAIWHNLRAIAPGASFDWRLLANGYIDELLYETGAIDNSRPLAELRARSDVTERAKACAGREEFSSCIREGM